MSLNYGRYKLKLAKTANVNDVQNVHIKNGEGKPKKAVADSKLGIWGIYKS